MRLALLFIPLCVFRFLFCFLTPLVWFLLWLPEEVLALLFSYLSWEWRFLYSYERYILISYVSWVLASQIMSQSSHCVWKWDGNSGCRLCIMVCPKFLVDYFMHIFYTYCLGLMKSVGSHGSSSLLLMMKVKVSLCEWLSYGYECTHCYVMLSSVVEISLQSHRYDFWLLCWSLCMDFIKELGASSRFSGIPFQLQYPQGGHSAECSSFASAPDC